MNYEELIDTITPEVYENLKTAVEIGRWPDGNKLSDKQREQSLQAIIAYEIKYVPAEQRTGFVPPKPTACDHTEPNAETELKWK